VEIRAGYDIAFQCFQETPMTPALSIEPARVGDLLSEHKIQLSPDIPWLRAQTQNRRRCRRDDMAEL